VAGRLRLDLDVPSCGRSWRRQSPTQPPDRRFDGKIDLGSDVTISEGAEKIDAVLALRAALQGLPSGAAELLGREPRLDVRASLETGRSVPVSELAFKRAAIDLTGKGSLQLASEQKLAADFALELPRLAAASDFAGQPLSGSLAANVRASGSMSEPNVVLATHIDRLKAERFDFSEITLDADAGGPIDRLAGRSIRFDAHEAHGSIALGTHYARDGRNLDIRNLSLGEADLDLTTQLANGRMNGRMSDQTSWVRPRRACAGGRLDASAELAGVMDDPLRRQPCRFGSGSSLSPSSCRGTVPSRDRSPAQPISAGSPRSSCSTDSGSRAPDHRRAIRRDARPPACRRQHRDRQRAGRGLDLGVMLREL
jgi:hypothetical protein